MPFTDSQGLTQLSAQLSNVSLLKTQNLYGCNKKITFVLCLVFWFLQVLSILSVSFLAVEKVSDISPLLFTGILEVS